MEKARDAFVDVLEGYTLGDLVRPRGRLAWDVGYFGGSKLNGNDCWREAHLDVRPTVEQTRAIQVVIFICGRTREYARDQC